MKNKRDFFIIAGLVIFLSFFQTIDWAWAQGPAGDRNLNDFVIQVRQNKHTLEGAFKRYVKAEDLGTFFGINVRSIDDGKAAMVGHLYYDNTVRPYKGSAYIDARQFFDFFDVDYTRINDWTYRLTYTSIPMFNQITKRFEPEGSMKVSGKQVEVPVLMIRNRKYVQLEILTDSLNLPQTGSIGGRVLISGKPVPRWVNHQGKIYVFVDDAARASGKAIQ